MLWQRLPGSVNDGGFVTMCLNLVTLSIFFFFFFFNRINWHLATGSRSWLALKSWGTNSKHLDTHAHTRFPGNLNQRLCRAVTLASAIDCPPRFVCLWAPMGIPLEFGESMRARHRKTISPVAAISPGTQTCMSLLVSVATVDGPRQDRERVRGEPRLIKTAASEAP